MHCSSCMPGLSCADSVCILVSQTGVVSVEMKAKKGALCGFKAELIHSMNESSKDLK